MRVWLAGGLLLSGVIEAATLPKIGLVEFYGLKAVNRESLVSVLEISRGDWMPVGFDPAVVPESELRGAFGIPEGSPLPQSEREIIRRMKRVEGVHDAKVVGVCCEPDGTATLFVGLQEKAEALFTYRKVGDKQTSLSLEIISLYDRFMEALSETVRKGKAQEDSREGHALFADKTLQNFTGEFLEYARANTKLLAEVMNESADPRQRIAAAWIIGYGVDKKFIAGELLRAVQDENEQVRNNATRSIAPIITLAQREPSLGIQIDAGPFIRMLHSLSWSDRNKGTMVLLALSKPRPPEILAAVFDGGLEPLIEMANWEDSHNRMALTLLARLAGVPDAQAEDLKNRAMLIGRAMRKK